MLLMMMTIIYMPDRNSDAMREMMVLHSVAGVFRLPDFKYHFAICVHCLVATVYSVHRQCAFGPDITMVFFHRRDDFLQWKVTYFLWQLFYWCSSFFQFRFSLPFELYENSRTFSRGMSWTQWIFRSLFIYKMNMFLSTLYFVDSGNPCYKEH